MHTSHCPLPCPLILPSVAVRVLCPGSCSCSTQLCCVTLGSWELAAGRRASWPAASGPAAPDTWLALRRCLRCTHLRSGDTGILTSVIITALQCHYHCSSQWLFHSLILCNCHVQVIHDSDKQQLSASSLVSSSLTFTCEIVLEPLSRMWGDVDSAKRDTDRIMDISRGQVTPVTQRRQWCHGEDELCITFSNIAREYSRFDELVFTYWVTSINTKLLHHHC